MSVSDPLLKKLKSIIFELRSDKKEVTDFHSKLRLFCRFLEDIFHKGLKNHAWFGKTTLWSWVVKIPEIKSKDRLNPILGIVIENVKSCPKTKTDIGRSRLFIRTALVKKVLGVAVEIVAKDEMVLEKWYDPLMSILGNDILREIYSSLQHQINEITFQLQLRNASFLDTDWELPIYREFEFVPCKELGLHYQVHDGYPVIIHVKPGSVAGEYGKVGVGDVIDELSGICLKGCAIHKVQEVFRQNHNLPLQIALIKPRTETGKLFSPIRRLIEDAGLDPNKLQCPCKLHEKCQENGDMHPAHTILLEDGTDLAPINSPEGRAIYKATYVGKTFLEKDGRVSRVEDAIPDAIKESVEKLDVEISIQETGVIITRRSDGTREKEVLFEHIFPRISSCGRRVDMMKYFSYIAGETSCSLSQEFYAFVFEAQTEEESRFILRGIAQGFERTLWSA